MPHTPAPWSLKRLSQQTLLVIGPDGAEVIAAINGPDPDPNAGVIVEAPAMVQALLGLTPLGHTPDGGVIVGPVGWQQAQDVLRRIQQAGA